MDIDIAYALECASEDQIADELRRRFTAHVLVYEQDCLQKHMCRNNTRWSCSYPHALGLLAYAEECVRTHEVLTKAGDDE